MPHNEAMNLSGYLAAKKQAVYVDLQAGRPPSEGRFDAALWKEGNDKSKPQIGSTVLEPHLISLQFIYPAPQEAALILRVEFDPPERIVQMPVPDWVVESIWQGEISGSPQFESDARRMMADFAASLEPGANDGFFGPQAPKRRE
jgi:hypothetical protein